MIWLAAQRLRAAASPTSCNSPTKMCRREGYPVADEDAAHLTPALHDHVNFYGTYSFDLDTELRRVGHNPLRSPAA